MTTDQGADERRIRRILLGHGVGPDAPPKPAYPPAAPTPDPDGWWADLYPEDDDEPAGPQPVALPGASAPRMTDWWARKPVDLTPEVPAPAVPDEPSIETPTPWLYPAPGYYPELHTPTVHVPHPNIALSPKTRAGLYNAAAGGAGWGLGLLDLLRGWIADCGSEFSVAGALVLGVGSCLALAHFWDRRTRHWWYGLAWVARIPLATAVLAVALYAPTNH